uniref:Uncharacterized protein n=1 Tax=Sphaerodactylus townsendi TaxID=933632 RepID=A0ACB8FPZ2_9SAUR
MGRKKRQRDAEENTPPTAKQLKIADFYNTQVPTANRFSAPTVPDDERGEDKVIKEASRQGDPTNNTEETKNTTKGRETPLTVSELSDQLDCTNLLHLTARTVEHIHKELRMLNSKLDAVIKEQENKGRIECEVTFEQLEIIKRLETLKCDLIKSKKCQTETLQPTQDPRDLLYTKAPTSPESLPLLLSPKGQKDMDEAPQTLHQVQRVEVTHEIELDSHLSGALSYNLFSEKVGTTWAQELAEYNTQTMIKSFSKEPNLSDLSPEKMESRQSTIQGKNGSIFMDHQGTLNQITSD